MEAVESNERNMELCCPILESSVDECLPEECVKCPPLPTRKPCGKAPRFQPNTGTIPGCLPPLIKEPCKPPLEPVGAFSNRPGIKIEVTDRERHCLCHSGLTPDWVTDWQRICPKTDDDPKQIAPRFMKPEDGGKGETPAQLPEPLECCRPPIRKALLRQDLCRREHGSKWQAPFIPILNTRGLDPKAPRDLAPPSSKDKYTSTACLAGFFGNVAIPEANPCHVSEEEKNCLYQKMVYTTTARRMMDDIPFTPNVRLPLTTTLEKRADMVKYRPKCFAPVTQLWQLVPTIWDRSQLRTKVDNVVGDRDVCPKINNIFPNKEMLLNNRMIMPPCPVAPSCLVCKEDPCPPKYECAVVCPHEMKLSAVDKEIFRITPKSHKIK